MILSRRFQRLASGDHERESNHLVSAKCTEHPSNKSLERMSAKNAGTSHCLALPERP